MSNVLAQSMGHNAVRPALGKLALRNRDCLLVCSDGLTRAVNDGDIVDIIVGADSLSSACDRLIALANERGGTDNITVVLVGVSGDLAEATAGGRLSGFEVLQSYAPTAPQPRGQGARLMPAEVKFVR
jgi:serine/threonine protein phosphatase PrpC